MAPSKLTVLAEKSITRPLKLDLLEYCPTMDLIALATSEDQVYVYRLNGQRVFGAGSEIPSLQVSKLRWKPNGQLLAVGWNDGMLRIVSADNSKVVNQIEVSAAEDDEITCLGWGLNYTDSKGSKARIDASGDTLDDILGQIVQGNVSNQTLDLPRDLAALDIEGTLPKLSMLPSGGKNEDVFSSRASIDALFSPLRKQENDAVDVLDLPSRFIRNIDESLEEGYRCTFVQAAYHLVVTGNCYPPVKEWLVEELAERGHKRWDKAVTTGYENIIRLTHENLLPALERCSVITSRLRGLSKYQESSFALGLITRDLNNILDSINSMNLMSHSILKLAGVELVQFTAFSAWLRREIELQAADPLSTTHDPDEKDTLIEHTKVLEYIQESMTKSRLTTFFQANQAEKKRTRHSEVKNDFILYDDFKKELEKDMPDTLEKAILPSLELLTINLQQRCEVVFKQIAETQRRHVHFGTPVVLKAGRDAQILDMRMRHEDNLCCSYIALLSPISLNDLYIFRVALRIQNGISSTHLVEVALLRLGAGTIADVKFADDQALMVLWRANDTWHLLNIPYGVRTDILEGLDYIKWTDDTSLEGVDDEARGSASALILSDEEVVAAHSHHAFDEGIFIPWKLEINGRKSRRVVCVFSKDKMHYQVLDIDSTTSPENPREQSADDAEMK
ncbi:MAG: hypothetical protein M1837_005392 [Sclerophora amabilis]|nr:MAG: hypothetical protein M1837_005392 [Sclerophora amabilis]